MLILGMVNYSIVPGLRAANLLRLPKRPAVKEKNPNK